MTDFYQKTPEQQLELYQRLAEQALAHWALRGSGLSAIKVRENAVFKVISDSKKKYALRIHRAGYHSDASLKSELQWMQALEQTGIEVPEPVTTLDGRMFIVLDEDYMGEPRQIDLFGWVEGEQLGSVERGLSAEPDTLKQNFRTIGELAGRVHNQSSAWTIPAGFTRHAWDADGLVGENPFWGRFWELEALTADERSLMEKVRKVIARELSTYGKSPDNYSIIHADMVPENVMIDGQHIRLIDFDDAGYGWHLFEIATSLYFSSGEDFFDDIKAATIEGYRSVRTLTEEDLEKLPLFLLARGTTYLGWVHTRKETETARELTPYLVELACRVADDYFSCQL